MILHAVNDNRTPSLSAAAPDHTGFQYDWMKDGGILKSIQLYEGYLIERMRKA